MARRRTSTAEDIMELTSKLPWWGGVLLAIISFIVLHFIASRPVTPVTDLQQIGHTFGQQIGRTFALFGQFILPMLFCVGALISFLRQTKQRDNYRKVEKAEPVNPLLNMSWREFEGLVAEFFKRRGYVVKLTGGDGPDGGVDVVLSKGNDKYLVQCKQWKAYKVGVQIVRELYGVMSATGAAGGFVITAGEFTPDAIAFAKGLNINLFNGARLQQMIRDNDKAAALELVQAQAEIDVPVIPRCPKCGESLVLRTAQKGPNAGQQFWGCRRFPQCRGTSQV